MSQFDVVVIGAGPAGYAAAIRCAQLGLATACVDNWLDTEGKHQPGGSCVNVGCIPSKALLDSSQLYYQAQHRLQAHGIQISGLSLDLEQMQSRKRRIVSDVSQHIHDSLLKQGVSLVVGTGKLLTGNRVEVTPLAGEVYQLQANKVILATGSRPMDLVLAPANGTSIVNSTGAMEFTEVPKRLGIIGGGVVGLELGSIWNRLGAEVCVLEAQDRFLSFADQDISTKALEIFRHQGLDIRLEARVVSAQADGEQVKLTYQDRDGHHELVFDRLIVASGRRPYSDNLIAAEVNMVFEDGGFIHVNDDCATSIPGVYAIGDLVRGPMLAHRGMQEGLSVASLLAGQPVTTNYSTIPSVIYTQPGIAWVGATERELQQQAVDYKLGMFPFAASNRATALEHGEGYIKVLANAQTDRILGVHIIGAQAPELIAEAVIAMEFEASSEDIALTVFAHPTLSEVFREAAMAVNAKPIHGL